MRIRTILPQIFVLKNSCSPNQTKIYHKMIYFKMLKNHHDSGHCSNVYIQCCHWFLEAAEPQSDWNHHILATVSLHPFHTWPPTFSTDNSFIADKHPVALFIVPDTLGWYHARIGVFFKKANCVDGPPSEVNIATGLFKISNQKLTRKGQKLLWTVLKWLPKLVFT